MKYVIKLHDCLNESLLKKNLLETKEDGDGLAVYKTYKRINDCKYNFVSFNRKEQIKPTESNFSYDCIRDIKGGDSKKGTKSLFIINPYKITSGNTDMFLKMWNESAHHMKDKNGFVHAYLYRSVSPSNKIKLVSIAEWRSEALFMNQFEDNQFKNIIEPFASIFAITFNREVLSY